MKHITTYNEFVNEGKITRFILKSILQVTGYINILAQKIKGNYFPFRFKDKKLESELTNTTIDIIDVVFTNALKMRISKKINNEVYNTSFSEYIKLKSGIDVYKSSEDIIDKLKIENLIVSDNEDIKQKQVEKLNQSIELFKKIISIVKMVDDSVFEHQKFLNELKELTEIMKELDPRNPKTFDRSKEETLGHFDKALSHLDDMQAPKELDDILDKISKYGMDSLTPKEKEDLNTWSK